MKNSKELLCYVLFTGWLASFGLLELSHSRSNAKQDPVPTPVAVSWTDVELGDAIRTAAVMAQPVLLPRQIILTQTVDLRQLSGLAITGTSNSMGRINDPLRANPEIIWRGPADQPVFRSRGSGILWAGFHVHLEEPASAIFQFDDAPGFADGKSYIERVSVTTAHNHCYDFVRCGNAAGDGHCDTITIDNCRTQFAKSFMRVNNHQSMGHVIRSPHTINSLVGLNLAAGGIVHVEGIWTSIRDGVLVQLQNQGRNNGLVVVEHLKLDSQSSQLASFKLVNALGTTSARVRFNNGVIPHLVSEKWSLTDMLSLRPNVVVETTGLQGLRLGVTQ